MDYQSIIYEKSETGRVARIILNRPEKANTVSNQMLKEVMDAFDKAEEDYEVRMVVLKGNGRGFSGGFDLTPTQMFMAKEGQDPRYNIERDRQVQLQLVNRFTRIWNFPKPTVAQIHGYCLGGACDLVLHCDFILASLDCRIGIPYISGSPFTHMYTYHVGPQWAKWMLLSVDEINGKTAEKIGLVFKAVPSDRLEKEANHLAEYLAQRRSEFLAINKSVVNKAVELMGRTPMQFFAAEADTIAHRTPVPGGPDDITGLEYMDKLGREIGVRNARLKVRQEILKNRYSPVDEETDNE